MDDQKGCGLCCAVLSLLSETSPLIGRHSAVQPKGMGLHYPNIYNSLKMHKKLNLFLPFHSPPFCQLPQNADKKKLIQEFLPQPMREQIASLLHTIIRGKISKRRPMQTNLNWLLILIKTSAILLKFCQEDTFVLDFQFLKSSCPWKKEAWMFLL